MVTSLVAEGVCGMCADVPGRSLPLCGTCDVVQVLYPSGSCPPLFPAVDVEDVDDKIRQTGEKNTIPHRLFF